METKTTHMSTISEIVMGLGREMFVTSDTQKNSVWTLEKIQQACDGIILYGDGETLGEFGDISTDTRTINDGDIFLALKGDNFDGANYIHAAIEKGAACIICEKEPGALPVPCVIVSDALYALGELAGYRRKGLKKLKVIGLTGSSGKTTVKEMTASILEQHRRVIKTKGNFNNLIGMPLSLLPADENHDFAILEMGMNRPGEIARLTEIANPDVACILNVHEAHIAGLGSVEGVAKAKGELFQNCSDKAELIVNLDDERVAALADTVSGKKTTFGLNPGAFVRASKINNKGVSGMEFTLHVGEQKKRILVKAFGLHNVTNCLAAAAISHVSGVRFTDIARGLASHEPPQKRLQICQGVEGILLVNDSYNANPASMRAAIETVGCMKKEGKAAAVLGDMLELGDISLNAHRKIGSLAACNNFDYLLVVGDYADAVVEAAKESGMNENNAFSFAGKDALAAKLDELVSEKLLGKGDLLLFKGSRGMRMETLIDQLMGEDGLKGAE